MPPKKSNTKAVPDFFKDESCLVTRKQIASSLKISKRQNLGPLKNIKFGKIFSIIENFKFFDRIFLKTSK